MDFWISLGILMATISDKIATTPDHIRHNTRSYQTRVRTLAPTLTRLDTLVTLR